MSIEEKYKHKTQKNDSLTLGSSNAGGQIKIYFDIDTESYEQIASKCDKALKLWKAIVTLSGKGK